MQVVAERTGSDPAVLSALLYGGAPAEDSALVRLADDLRTLEASLAPAGLAAPSSDTTPRTTSAQEVAGP